MYDISEDSHIVQLLKKVVGTAALSHTIHRGELTFEIGKDDLLDVCNAVKSDESIKLDFLHDVVGMDYLDLDDGPRMGVIYHLYSIQNAFNLRLKVRLDDGEHIPSVTGIWRAADWAEREAYDLYGIVFDGHPDLRRIYLAPDWVGYPLRKDYPLKGYKDEYNPFGEEKEDE